MVNKDKSLVTREKKIFYISNNMKILGILQHPIDKAGSTTLFSSEDVFPRVSLSAKKLNFRE